MAKGFVQIVDGFSEKRFSEYLRTNYEDRPVVHLPGFVLTRMLKKWGTRGDVIFKVALQDGQPVGFVFGQSVGSRPWKSLLIDPIGLPAAAWVLVRERLKRTVSGKPSAHDKTQFPIYDEKRALVRREWQRGEAANIEFIFVEPSARGEGVAGELIRAFSDAVRNIGVGAAHAYIARHNVASAKAFQKSGWSIFDDQNTLRATSRIGAE